MKLSFSTIGCPDWDWNEIIATAKDLGMHGVEIRGIGQEMYAPKARPFLAANIDKTMSDLKKMGMILPILTSGCDVSKKDKAEAVISEAKDYIDLAHKVGAPYIRIMCEAVPAPEDAAVDLDAAADMYAAICDYAKEKTGEGEGAVYPLIETNARLAKSDVMLSFLKRVNRSNAFVLWDIHHPYRYYGEDPTETAEKLKGLVRHIHIKDSIVKDGKIQYVMMGHGDIPVLAALKVAKAGGYDGFVSLEWVKRWAKDLQEPGLVFPHYANYMQNLLAKI